MQIFVKVNGVQQVVETHPNAVANDIATCLAGQGHACPSFEGLVFKHRDRELQGTLAEAGVSTWDVLELQPRLLGGGGDGGATGAESRSCYLEMYMDKKPDKVNPEEERLALWTTCRLSGEALCPPIVADELGSLFNKEALLQALLAKKLPRGLRHIQGLKSVIPLKLEVVKPDGKPAGGAAAKFACPVTGLEFNGKTRFLVHRVSGQVISERALKEVPKVVEEIVGGAGIASDAWVPVNPAGEELETLRHALATRLEAKRAVKKEKVAAGDRPVANGNGAAAAPVANGHNGAAVNGESVPAGKRAAPAPQRVPEALQAKKSKVAHLAPAGADQKVWSSLFSSNKDPNGVPGMPNDFMVRGTAVRGMKMA